MSLAESRKSAGTGKRGRPAKKAAAPAGEGEKEGAQTGSSDSGSESDDEATSGKESGDDEVRLSGFLLGVFLL